jgi:hypothetical protein
VSPRISSKRNTTPWSDFNRLDDCPDSNSEEVLNEYLDIKSKMVEILGLHNRKSVLKKMIIYGSTDEQHIARSIYLHLYGDISNSKKVKKSISK